MMSRRRLRWFSRWMRSESECFFGAVAGTAVAVSGDMPCGRASAVPRGFPRVARVSGARRAQSVRAMHRMRQAGDSESVVTASRAPGGEASRARSASRANTIIATVVVPSRTKIAMNAGQAWDSPIQSE